MSQPILQAQNIVKRFGNVVALGGVTLDVRPGEIHALCGENGAGKSTLIKTLGGIYPHGEYEGEILVDGKVATFRGIADAEKAGIAVIHQELALVPELAVAENIFLGRAPTRTGLIDWPAMFEDARELLHRFQIDIAPDIPVHTLGVGHQQLVEIVRALGKESRVLILDEPTAALSEQEVQILLQILVDLKKRGIGMVYISHRLDEVFQISDRITVLRDGQSIITLDTPTTDKNEVIRQMVGREIKDLFPRRQTHVGDVRLRVAGLCVDDVEGRVLSDIDFEVHGGEVLGIGGLMGAGRSELLMHIFGAFGVRKTGSVELDGKPLQSAGPRECIDRGLVLVTEDRKRYGLVLEETIGFNLSLSSLKAIIRGLLLDPVREVTRNREVFTSLRVKAPDLEAIVGRLSGGNQQKVVLGKAILTKPGVIFLDEPTRGIDVGAKVEVYELINRLTADGLAVVLVSSELPELIGMSDRIMMLHEGRCGGVFERSQATQETLLAAAMGKHGAAAPGLVKEGKS